MYDGETLHFSRGELRPNQPTTCSSFLFLHVCRLGEDDVCVSLWAEDRKEPACLLSGTITVFFQSELVLISLPEDIIRATPPLPPETKHNG